MSNYIGTVNDKISVEAKLVNTYSYKDYKFSYYGDLHFIYTFVDEEGNVLVWKTTSCLGVQEEGKTKYYIVKKWDKVKLTGKVKEHSEYNDTKQTVLTRCKVEVLEKAITKEEILAQKKAEQLNTISGGDFIWTMPYTQYKEHYADCETVVGSFQRNERTPSTIDVIIREGRLKNSGVRGKHFYRFTFKTPTGTDVKYRAVSEETARKQMKKEYKDSDNWECVEIR